jgi:flavin reductase (DIM6/NTAB) family NADH-FMN oxidoreductase RutF
VDRAIAAGRRRVIWDTHALGGRERYQLLTSLVVPRPIAWISTRSADGHRNLAPFSYFGAVSATPFLVSVSIGSRAGVDKDTLRNIRDTGAFCVNLATEPQLAQVNESAGEWGPEVDEFVRAGLESAEADAVDAPYVADCPAVLECRVHQVVELEGSPNTLVLGEVLRVRVSDEVPMIEGTHFVDTAALRPVARLWGDLYTTLGALPALKRPAV